MCVIPCGDVVFHVMIHGPFGALEIPGFFLSPRNPVSYSTSSTVHNPPTVISSSHPPSYNTAPDYIFAIPHDVIIGGYFSMLLSRFHVALRRLVQPQA